MLKPKEQHAADGEDGVPSLTEDQFLARFRIIRTIGQGEFAKVKLAEDLRSGHKVAIKFIKQPSGAGEKAQKRALRIQREIHLMLRLWHPNIMQLLDVFRLCPRSSGSCVTAMVMPWATGGELFDLVQRRKRLSEPEARHFMYQLVDAVGFIHEKGIVHRDLKLENILLAVSPSADCQGRIVVTDFGFARGYCVAEGDAGLAILRTSCGSPCYAAPELVLDSSGYIGPPVDIWSCGVILYAMLMGHLPFEDEAFGDKSQAGDSTGFAQSCVYQLYRHIQQTNGTLRLSAHLSPAAVDLLHRMLDVNPMTRISVADIRTHPWLS